MNTCAGSVAEAPLWGQSRFKYRSTEMFSSHHECRGFKKKSLSGKLHQTPHQWQKADAALENYTEPAEHQIKWQYSCVTVSFKLQLFLDKNVFEYLQYCSLLSLWEVQHSLNNTIPNEQTHVCVVSYKCSAMLGSHSTSQTTNTDQVSVNVLHQWETICTARFNTYSKECV